MKNKSRYKHGGFILLTVVVTLALASCHTAKNVASLDYDSQGLFGDSIENTIDTTTIANIPWADYFSDNKLKSLIQEGLDNNLDVKVAIERIKQAQSSFSIAKAAKLPTLSIASQDEYTQYSSGNNGTRVLGYTGNTLALGFSSTWEIDMWQKLNQAQKAQYANYLNSYQYWQLIKTTLISNIAKGYYNLMALDEQLRITNATIALLKKSTESMQALKEAGLQNGAAVEQSKALLYKTQLTIPDIENSIRQQENAICLLTGRKPGNVQRNALSDQKVPTQLKCGVPAQMLAKRPDVKRAELNFEAAYHLTNVAQAAMFPSITISSTFIGYNSTTLSNLFDPESIALRLIGGITQPIFQKKQLRENLNIAKSQQVEAALNFRNTVLVAGKEVSDVLYGYHSSMSKNDIRAKQIESLTTAVDFTQDLLLAGEANYTEVLTAQQNLLSAQLGQISDLLSQLDYCVDLYKALGGGEK